MITGERRQRAAVMMVGEVDRRETADAVKRFCLELRGCCRESSSTERGCTRPLNRILEAAKIRREPKRALSEQNERGPVFGNGWGGSTKYRGVMRAGLVPPRERLRAEP
jgi:hypothetical protein